MEDNAELELFRRQWREEVAQRTSQEKPTAPKPKTPARTSTASKSGTRGHRPTRHEAADRKEEEEDEDVAPVAPQDEIVQQTEQLNLGPTDEDAFQTRGLPQREPSSAVEHFERAVQKEQEGSLGDSLQLYRKAYRLDSAVDKTYRNKHFAWAWKKPAHSTPVNAPAASTASKAAGGDAEEKPEVLPTPELIASFSHLPIPQVEPEIENTPPPPCPISSVPSEVIVEILRYVALMDPAAFYRMSLVCKRLAYHFAHEQHIWKRLCQGPEFGFGSMHYSFACDLIGNPEYTLAPRYTPFPRGEPVKIPEPLNSWSQVFQMFPRVRYTGVYISTVNYNRPGAASAYQNVSWNSPIHIVTYHRYLRFYPDGSVLSLLSTTRPLDVVPYLNKENVMAARKSNAPSQRQQQHHHHQQAPDLDHVPSTTMVALKYTRLGRWYIVKPEVLPDQPNPNAKPELAPDLSPANVPDKMIPDPSDVIIETEGSSPRHLYTLHLGFRSSSGARAETGGLPVNSTKNTKLAWKGYWSYNKITDDWAEFGLRNDRGFVFRRVRGWGMS